MGLFGKSFEEEVQEAVKAVQAKVRGVSRLAASASGKTVTLTGEAETVEAKGAAMAEFNKLVETENTFNKISIKHAAAPAASPAAPAAAPAAKAERTYEVKKGDTLSAIAKEFYGSANKYMKIFEANKDILSDPDKIKPGQKLRIPD